MKESALPLYTNREISWLQFNERVLEEAEDARNPLLERLKFLSIFTDNLDEFYRVRVGSLCDRLLLDEEARDDKPGRPLNRQLKDIFKATGALLPRFDAAYSQVLRELSAHGVRQLTASAALSDSELLFLRQSFEQTAAPVIAPFLADKRHPFPFFENGQRVIGVTLQTKNGHTRFGLIPLPAGLPDAVLLPGGGCTFMLTEDLLLLFAEKVFHKFRVTERAVFAIVRNADIDENEGLYDYDIDLKDTMSKLLERRGILPPVKLKYAGSGCDKLLSCLCRELYLKKKQVFRYRAPLDFRFLGEVEATLSPALREALRFPPAVPRKNPALDESASLLDQIRQRDALLSYPFEDVSALLTLLNQAAADPRVETLHITLYRVASRSRVVSALIDAAKNGKQVTCVIELRARFDEENNIDWASRLQNAGCRVLYGMARYKIHAKLLLIGLREADGQLHRVCLAGTGNFNETTARVYTDLSLLTAHAGITADVQSVFAAIERECFAEGTAHLLTAPLELKPRLIELIEGEIAKKQAGKPAAILLKLNSLTERELIDTLYDASRAGVKVQLLVRGMCCLRPGIPGVSEHITVRSIVGRYLEHARVFAFGVGRGRRYFLSSADWMTRNMTQRVEAAVPVYDKACKEQLRRLLQWQLADTVKARILRPEGHYERIPASRRRRAIDSQETLFSGESTV